MSIALYIEDDDQTYEVMEWGYKIHKETDGRGRATTSPIFSQCILKIPLGRMPNIVAWATHPTRLKRRVLIIEDPTQNTGKRITTELVDVKCINLELAMDAFYLELTAAGFCREDVILTAYWKKSLFLHEQTTTITEPEEEERIQIESTTGAYKEATAENDTSTTTRSNTDQDTRPTLQTPKSVIDIPAPPNPTQNSGIIYPNTPKLPELSEDALKNIPKNMQGVITEYPDDILADVKDEGMRQDIIIAATNPKDMDLQEKGVSAGQALLGKAITTVAIAGTAYSLFKSGKKMVQQVESIGKFLKKTF